MNINTPGIGSLFAAPIMVGLYTVIGKLPDSLNNIYSATFFENVYVLGNPLIISFSF